MRRKKHRVTKIDRINNLGFALVVVFEAAGVDEKLSTPVYDKLTDMMKKRSDEEIRRTERRLIDYMVERHIARLPRA